MARGLSHGEERSGPSPRKTHSFVRPFSSSLLGATKLSAEGELQKSTQQMEPSSPEPLHTLSQNAASVKVQLLDGGSFTAAWDKVHEGAEHVSFRMYNWLFYIRNTSFDRHVLWDVGMTSVRDTV